MNVQDLLTQCEALGVTLACGEHGTLRVSPPGVLHEGLRAQLRIHKSAVGRLLTAPPADVMSEDACSTCGSRERWVWLDRRLLCRACVVLDMTPLTIRTAEKTDALIAECRQQEGR
jgi:hypothetical protein